LPLVRTAASHGTAASPDDEFIFGLDRILDGVGLFIQRAQG
jgi:hypothetical protein